MSEIKKYTFVRECLSDEPSWEFDLFKSGDINGSYTSERSAMLSVATYENLVEEDVAVELSDYSLEELLITNNIYCEFVEG